ncbi:ABC-F family ATP-binding cassette domain-containing protein [Ancylobacter mangrovi]|uniref:ABC-F family ATP-binding cassette domain-containing protein n=1 Tax=Ancylobacter mangrovi TaxID=2972472 RepID=UPI00216200DD|nr:ABC-F family ATP-binding cassette domain-containing protein [Ancylobacter mangrovi]MCS0503343.1 ATP-binding cassette domain-containing protein [Ancylobacter mangrovi]
MASIDLSGLSWTAPDGNSLFTDLDLSFGPERTGVVGRNGTGKSSLLRLIAGDIAPQVGAVRANGRIGRLSQMAQVDPGMTIADLFGASGALALAHRAMAGEATIDELPDVDWGLEERLAAALTRMNLPADAAVPLARLSGGQRTRAGIAAAIFGNPDFLLLDEPTNNLDRAGRLLVIDLVSGWRSGAIIVSHDRELLDHVDTIVELTSLGVARYGGNWSAYRIRKATERAAAEHDLAHAEKQVAETHRKAQLAAERSDRRKANATRKGARGDLPRIVVGGRKNNAEASRSSGLRLIEHQRTRAAESASTARSRLEVLQTMSVKLPSTGLPASRQVLNLDDVTGGYRAANPIIRHFSLSMTGPERVALVGPNGSGKTTLLKLIIGSLLPTAGHVTVSVALAMLDQSVGMLDLAATLRDNFLRLNPGTGENACRAALANFEFRAEAAHQLAGMLSGGQLLRAGLACVLGGACPPSLLILDEPTNHLDIESIAAVERGLLTYDGALLVVSHDEAFLGQIGIERRISLG